MCLHAAVLGAAWHMLAQSALVLGVGLCCFLVFLLPASCRA